MPKFSLGVCYHRSHDIMLKTIPFCQCICKICLYLSSCETFAPPHTSQPCPTDKPVFHFRTSHPESKAQILEFGVTATVHSHTHCTCLNPEPSAVCHSSQVGPIGLLLKAQPLPSLRIMSNRVPVAGLHCVDSLLTLLL